MITASIVTYRTDVDELCTVVRCLSNCLVNKIYIVDNSPSDQLRETVYSLCSSKIEYIYGHGNVGYGAAHNIAIRQAIALGAIYHIVINPDIYFEAGTIEKLSAYMETQTGIGQLMPRVVYPNGELQYLCKLLPTPIDLIGRRFLPFKNSVKRRNWRFEMRASGYDQIMEVPFLSGCFMFLRVDALRKTNGFDNRYFMYCEDIDLCRRIGMVGYKTVYYPVVEIIHAHKKESYKNRFMLRQHIKSAFRYFNTWGWFFDSYRHRTNKMIRKQYE